MPGTRITDHQYRNYMKAKKLGFTQTVSAAKAGFSERSGRTVNSKVNMYHNLNAKYTTLIVNKVLVVRFYELMKKS